MEEEFNTVPENVTIEDHVAPALIIDENENLTGFEEVSEPAEEAN